MLLKFSALTVHIVNLHVCTVTAVDDRRAYQYPTSHRGDGAYIAPEWDTYWSTDSVSTRPTSFRQRTFVPRITQRRRMITVLRIRSVGIGISAPLPIGTCGQASSWPTVELARLHQVISVETFGHSVRMPPPTRGMSEPVCVAAGRLPRCWWKMWR